MIPVADGVSVAADVYTPKQPGRYPAVVAFAAYSNQLHSSGAPTATNEGGSPPIFTDRGYVHVIASRRGMGRSEGTAPSTSTTRTSRTTPRSSSGPPSNPGATGTW